MTHELLTVCESCARQRTSGEEAAWDLGLINFSGLLLSEGQLCEQDTPFYLVIFFLFFFFWLSLALNSLSHQEKQAHIRSVKILLRNALKTNERQQKYPHNFKILIFWNFLFPST